MVFTVQCNHNIYHYCILQFNINLHSIYIIKYMNRWISNFIFHRWLVNFNKLIKDCRVCCCIRGMEQILKTVLVFPIVACNYFCVLGIYYSTATMDTVYCASFFVSIIMRLSIFGTEYSVIWFWSLQWNKKFYISKKHRQWDKLPIALKRNEKMKGRKLLKCRI